MDFYRTVRGFAESRFTEKKSEFIGWTKPCDTWEEAKAFVDEARKTFPDARHFVSAFINKEGNVQRFDDDGEPKGTGGIPMLEVLKKEEVTGLCVVVTRYFGGTLLGTGGLIRAYGQTVKEALANSEIGEEVKGIMLTIKAEYTLLGKIQYTLAQKGVEIMDTIYESDVMLTIRFRSELLDAIEKELINVTSGKIEICDRAECFYLQKE